jgi:hypothetical protein
MAYIQVAFLLLRIIIPMIIVFGIVGNSLNIIILTRRTLRSHACSKYFLVMAINNVLYSSTVLIYRLLVDGYHIDPSIGSLVQCKIVMYLINLCTFMSPYFIVLASIDRFCGSSTSARLRKGSSVRVAYWMIAITIIIFALFFIPFIIYSDIRLDDGLGCNLRTYSVSQKSYLSTEIILFAGVAPLLMILFGLFTIYNTQHIRVAPNARHRRTESQLARMLLLQVGIHVLLTLPTCIIYLLFVILPPLNIPSWYFFAATILPIPLHLSYTTAFVLYTLSARTYRQEFIRLFHKMTQNRFGNGDNQIHARVVPLTTMRQTLH